MSAEALSPEREIARARVRAALSEVGITEVHITDDGVLVGVPWAEAWRAGMAARIEGMPCWPRYFDAAAKLADPCEHDPWTSPWPEVAR